jgi:hypothetical protein
MPVLAPWPCGVVPFPPHAAKSALAPDNAVAVAADLARKSRREIDGRFGQRSRG